MRFPYANIRINFHFLLLLILFCIKILRDLRNYRILSYFRQEWFDKIDFYYGKNEKYI